MIMRYYQQGYLTGQNVGKCREFHELCYYRPLMSSAFVSLPFVKKLILYDFLVSLSAIYAKKRRLLVYWNKKGKFTLSKVIHSCDFNIAFCDILKYFIRFQNFVE